MAPCPEVKIKPLWMMAWEYGPPVIAALSVWKACFSTMMTST
jgi:hypothetical protein